MPLFELSDFYEYCRENQVDVIPFDRCPQEAATIRDHGFYAVFLNLGKLPSLKLLRGVCCHELGHVATGALHKVDSPFELVERSEYRANRYVAEHFLTPADFAQAFSQGYTEPWQLSDFFELPEADVCRALTYWKEAQGMDFPAKEP